MATETTEKTEFKMRVGELPPLHVGRAPMPWKTKAINFAMKNARKWCCVRVAETRSQANNDSVGLQRSAGDCFEVATRKNGVGIEVWLRYDVAIATGNS